MYLTCDEKYNIEKIDNILLKSGNFELKLFANDFFEFSDEQNKYISKLVVDMNEKDLERLLELRQELANSIIDSKPEDLFVIIK